MNERPYARLSTYAGRFFSGVLLSRVSGMVRDVAMACLFGDQPAVASFMVAFRFSHFLRRLIGEGALRSTFIPKYEELKLEDEKKASEFFFRIRFLLCSMLLILVAVVEVFLGIGSKFFSFEEQGTRLFAWMFASLPFIGLYGLNTALLECKNSFFSASAAPLVCNLTWIAGLFLFVSEPPAVAMEHLAICTLVGFILQWVVTLPQTRSLPTERSNKLLSPFPLPKEIRSFGKTTSLALIGIGAVQINSFFDTLFAQFAETGGPVYIWYAARLYQLPLALIGLSCIHSVIPSLSRALKEGNRAETVALFSFGLDRIFLLLIPCTFAIFALALPAVNLLFGRGEFSEDAVQRSAECLLAYAPGLLGWILCLYRSSVFYAHGDAETPMKASLASILLNVTLNALLIFVFGFGAVSVALATTIGAWFQYALLETVFAKKLPERLPGPNPVLIGKIVFVSAIAYFACSLFDLVPVASKSRQIIPQAVRFLTSFSVFIITFALSVRLLYKEIYREMKSFIFPKPGETGDAG